MIDKNIDNRAIVDYNRHMIERPSYIEAISASLGKPLIKVLTGIRRCGKSSVLALLVDELRHRGVGEEHILAVNMESLEFDSLREYQAMYRFVKESLPRGGYLLLDEAQEVSGWERITASLLAEGSVECIVTGSNASLLSSDLGTLLTGRFMEIPVHTLSFPEFRVFSDQSGAGAGTQDLLARYLRQGGFPALHRLGPDEESRSSYLATLLDAILMRDVVARHSIRDPDALRRILAYAFDNVGNLTSARRVSEFWKSQRRSISTDTVASYLGFLCDAFILHRARRFDLKGKQHLEYSEKYYAGDLGLRHGLLGRREDDIAGLVENAVYLELRRRGYAVSVGVMGDREVDFVAERGGARRYYQVCAALDSPATVEREFSALAAIDDQWPKTVIVFAPTMITGRSGIGLLSLEAFLEGAE